MTAKRFPPDFFYVMANPIHYAAKRGFSTGEHSGDHNHQDFPKSTAIQMGGVLRYKWEAYCDTNGRSTDSISFSSKRRGTKSTAIQIGGVLQYKWEAYCDTFLRSSGGWGF